jgi:hypothetical protein
MLHDAKPPLRLNDYEYVLINTKNPGWRSSSEFSEQVADELRKGGLYKSLFERNGVYLFRERIDLSLPEGHAGEG